MKEQIEEMYSHAVYEDLAPNIFADQVLNLLKPVIQPQPKPSALKEALQDKIRSFEAAQKDPNYQSNIEQNVVAVALRELRYLDSIVEFEECQKTIAAHHG